MENHVLETLPDDFDWEVYCKLNADVSEIYSNNKGGAEQHYLKDGYKQNRRYAIDHSLLPSDFDWKIYLLINPDVQSQFSTELLTHLHYTTCGYIDGRAYCFKNIPDGFDCDSYVELNCENIDKYYIQTDNHIKLHYEIFGYKADLSYNNDFDLVPDDFEWKMYIKLNASLPIECNSELKCRQHYHHYGIYQQFIYSETHTNNVTNTEWRQYPILFHKYILNLAESSDNIPYVINNYYEPIHLPFSMVLHIHCYDLNNFTTYFGKYWMIIQSECPNVIITYCVGDILKLKYYKNITVLHCENKGMDIGGKFTCVYHLNKHHITYDYIFFIHSKSDKQIRELYIEPIIDNLQSIKQKLCNDPDIGVVVPPLVYTGDYANIVYKHLFTNPNNITRKWNFGNSLYINELDQYMKLDRSNFMFPEGNCFICKWDIANQLYGDLKLYHVLNTVDSFDAVWVQSYYGRKQLYDISESIYDCYRFFNKCNYDQTIYPNNIAWGAGHNGHPDNMIEHAFERLIFKMVQKLKYKVCIIPYKDCPIYMKDLQSSEDEINSILYTDK